jgi:hypothetical protein
VDEGWGVTLLSTVWNGSKPEWIVEHLRIIICKVDSFDNAVRKTFTVSNEETQRRQAEWQRMNSKRRAKKL